MKIVSLAALVLVMWPAFANAQCGGWGWGGMMGGWGGFMMLFWVIVLVLIIYGIFSLGRSRGGGTSERTGGRALDILKERYAKGEITKEQYEQIKKDIES